MQFSVNQSPLAGREATLSSTSRQLRARLERELLTNVALRVADGPTADIFEVSGRGELHLAILIETMRREGYEFEVSRPAVITREIDGHRHEPVEECIIDCDADAVGRHRRDAGLARRRSCSRCAPTRPGGRGSIHHAPTRALIGLRSQILTLTRGTGRDVHAPARLGALAHAAADHAQRRAHRQPAGHRRGLRPARPPGARPAVHRPRHDRVRRHDRRPQPPPRRHAPQRHQAEAEDQHPLLDRGRHGAPGAAANACRSRRASTSSRTTSSSR